MFNASRKTISKLGFALCLAGTLCYARDRGGTLMDASCFEKTGAEASWGHTAPKEIAKTCAPTASTTDFAFQAWDSGRVYKFDDAGNAIAQKAMEDQVVKVGSHGDMRVEVEGTHKTGVMAVSDLSSLKYRGVTEY